MKRTITIFLLLWISLTVLAVTYNVTVPAGTKVCYIAGEMNSWSQVVYSSRLVPQKNHVINISQLPQGVYFIQLKTSQSTETRKIMFE